MSAAKYLVPMMSLEPKEKNQISTNSQGNISKTNLNMIRNDWILVTLTQFSRSQGTLGCYFFCVGVGFGVTFSCTNVISRTNKLIFTKLAGIY